MLWGLGWVGGITPLNSEGGRGWGGEGGGVLSTPLCPLFLGGEGGGLGWGEGGMVGVHLNTILYNIISITTIHYMFSIIPIHY